MGKVAEGTGDRGATRDLNDRPCVNLLDWKNTAENQGPARPSTER